MNTLNLIRAWKDASYRATLTTEELTALPENPAGLIELDDAALGDVNGAILPGYGPTKTDEGCTVSGAQVPSCGWICTYTKECQQGTDGCCPRFGQIDAVNIN